MTYVLTLRGHGDSLHSVQVLPVQNRAAAEHYMQRTDTGPQDYWTRCRILALGDVIEFLGEDMQWQDDPWPPTT